MDYDEIDPIHVTHNVNLTSTSTQPDSFPSYEANQSKWMMGRPVARLFEQKIPGM